MTPHTQPLPVPGTNAHLVHTQKGQTFIRTRNGRFLSVTSQPDATDASHTSSSQADQATMKTDEPHMHEMLALVRPGLVERENNDREAAWPTQRRRVTLIGESIVLDEIAVSLQNEGVECERHMDGSELHTGSDLAGTHRTQRTADSHLVIAVEFHHATRWDHLDAGAGKRWTWLRAYREGEVCLVDPITCLPEDANHEQVWRRRLAASLAPDALATWREYSEPTHCQLTPLAQNLLTARLLTMAMAWASGADSLAAYRRTLWKFQPAAATVTEHLVFAYDTPHMPPVSVANSA